MASRLVHQVVWSALNDLDWAVIYQDDAPSTFAVNTSHKSHESGSVWTDSRVVAAYVAAVSVVIAFVQALLLTPPAKRIHAKYFGSQSEPVIPLGHAPEGAKDRLQAHIKAHGGGIIFTCQVARMLASLALMGLVVVSTLRDRTFSDGNIALISVIGYGTTMNVLSVCLPASLAWKASTHSTVSFLGVLGSFVYRDIWPLVTYTLVPIDRIGPVLWAEVTLAGIAAVLPAFEPYPYVPVDPLNPQAEVNAEQTASIFSFVFYFFLDGLIFKAAKLPHIKSADLPPMCDYDYAKNLIQRSYPHLDRFAGAPKSRSLFIGLVRIFRTSLLWQSLVLFINAFSKIASPVGTNRLLAYLESGGAGATVKPWFWAMCLGLGPLLNTTCFQLYIYLSTASLSRVEGIITSLVFEHALRIRLKAELPDSLDVPSGPAGPVGPIAAADPQTAESTLAMEEGEPPAVAQGLVKAGDATSAHSPSPTTTSVTSSSTAVGSTAGSANDRLDVQLRRQRLHGAREHAQDDRRGDGPAVAGSHKLDADRFSSSQDKKTKSKKNENLTGRLSNLITSDLQNITGGRDFLFVGLNAPINLLLGVVFLYAILDWASIVGLVAMLVLMPVPAWFASRMQTIQKEKMDASDARVKAVTETMSTLRMIKLFGWEVFVRDDMDAKRRRELKVIFKRKMLELLNSTLNHVIPLLHMLVTFGTYTIVMKRELSASIVFSSMSGFNMLRQQLFMVTHYIPRLVQANVSLKRLQDFLESTELLDEYAAQEAGTSVVDASRAHAEDIGISAASFMWSADLSSASSTPATPGGPTALSSKGRFRLRVEDELVFKKGAINLIVGPTGSGKTSILMALLGEMHYLPDGPGSWNNLPRAGGIAYAAQESWVQNETIRENILFGQSFDEARYKKGGAFALSLKSVPELIYPSTVIHACGLKRDLSLFETGDATEVGEKGLTLSGGQKARVTLARAIYSNASILLLDDILAALDVHTSKWIVEKCLRGDLVHGRTIILVTHNVALVAPVASFVVSLSSDGRIVSQGSISDAIAHDNRLAWDMAKNRRAIEQDVEGSADLDEEAEVKDSNGKLIMDEEIAEGHVSRDAFLLFINAVGGSWSMLFWIAYLLFTIAAQAADAGETWVLGLWAKQYPKFPGEPTKVDAGYYIGVYSSLVTVVTSAFALSQVVYTLGTIRASRSIHQRLVASLLASTFRWLDQVPQSRIIARCTQDIQSVDGGIADGLGWLIDITTSMGAQLAAVLIFTPIFVVPGIILAILGGLLGQVYIKGQLAVKREMSNAKAPVIGIFNGAMAGIVSIRAYNAQEMFRLESQTRIDRYVKASRNFYNLNRWITTRIDALSSIFVASLAMYLLYGPNKIDPSNVGFSLSMAVGFSGMILFWVRIVNDLEVEANSLERIDQYINNEQEPKPTEGGVPPAYWPSSGTLRVENLSARYSQDGPKVLHDISFEIKSGERVGVVGRTGSGKSSLTLSLLRCIPTEGSVYYDGLPTSSLNLDSLRGNITIIPQVPELMSGTLRHNLDMFGQHDDAVLNDALRSAGLYSLQTDADENKLGLDSPVSSGGGNLSVGQRQIIALARALVRDSKILILDEATSAVDYETDAVIQNSLRNEFKSDVSVITVAHRLQTVLDSDKIMVLDAGRLVEFDSPAALLEKDGLLKSLVDESADKDILYAMAGGKKLA